MSDFEKVGVAFLSSSKKALKLEIKGQVYYVGLSDVYRAIKEPRFAASIIRTVPAAAFAEALSRRRRA